MEATQLSAPTGESPVDLGHLFEAVGGLEEEARALIAIYSEQASELFERLEAAVTIPAVPEIEHLAHKLAGSSASCGFTALVGPLRDLEHAARSGRLSAHQAQELCRCARARYAQVQIFLSAVFA
jgi:HPt (histidine-containing phosphotransfer) domain-containing protein